MSAIKYLQSSMTLHKTIYQNKFENIARNDFFANEKNSEKEKIKRGEFIRKEMTKGYLKLLSACKEG
ncbi:hypothetical protein P4T89_12875 [Bacillus nakamurai]|uniref:Uncharacterized protein n=1 Tax=Bacillus nakamurai TaxID=1793963 RepID=A0A150FAW9_9BACI|nr:hypothetical protein [Bacillus nakamurai]KXZ22366.1 hypothetical protein AXI58_10270 [Bacillus nakamurai]MED1228409.1 hypothetical protein [Bacillus nakamurai]